MSSSEAVFFYPQSSTTAVVANFNPAKNFVPNLKILQENVGERKIGLNIWSQPVDA